MPVVATFTLRAPSDWRGVVDLVRQHAGPMADRGTPLRVVVALKHATRRLEANAAMWAGVLDQIARQACIRGQWFSAASWHEWLKRECLPEVCAKGTPKWAYHADGTRSLLMSTSDLDDAEFAVYVEQIQAYAAIEYGVIFHDRDEA